MVILNQGHSHALYKSASKMSWIGRLSSFEKGKEVIPLMIGEDKLILEFVIPEHLMDSDKEPRYYLIDDGKHFLMRRNYREINLYKLTENNFMDMVRGDELTFSSSEFGPMFISTIRKALCFYVSKNPCTTQFVFQAQGRYGQFISSTLANRDDDIAKQYRVNVIPDLAPPYYGFELDILSLTNNYGAEAV